MGQMGWGAALQALGQDIGRLPERLQQARQMREWPEELRRQREMEDLQRRQLEQAIAAGQAREGRAAEEDTFNLQNLRDRAGAEAVKQIPFDLAVGESAPAVQRAQGTPASAVLEAIGGKMPGTETAFAGMQSDPAFLGASTSAAMGGLKGEKQFRRLPLMDEKLLLGYQKAQTAAELGQGRLGVAERQLGINQTNADANTLNAESLAELRRTQQSLNAQREGLLQQQAVSLQNGDMAAVIRLQQQMERLNLDRYRIEAQLDAQFKTPFGGRVQGAPPQPTAPVINNYMIPPPATVGGAGAPAAALPAAPPAATPPTDSRVAAFAKEVERGDFDDPAKLTMAKQRLSVTEGKTPAELLSNALALKVLQLRELQLAAAAVGGGQ